MSATRVHRGRMPPSSYETASIRSSSEDTAATIFSMYEDPAPLNMKQAPPVPVLDPKYRSDMSRPISIVSDRSGQGNRRSYGPLETQGRPSYSAGRNSGSPYATRQSSLQQDPGLKPARTPSPRLAISMNTQPYPSQTSPGPSPDSELLTPADRERRPSSKHSTRTILTQTSHTTPTTHTEYTSRHSNEDADAFRVRATYAKLEAEGVPGDGWLEGVERTRTRVVSAASAAVLEATRGTGGKGADVGAEEEARLKSTDRYGFFVNPTPKHEGRLALLPALPLKTFASPHKPVSIPLPTDIPTLPPISRVPPPTVSPRENTRIGKWERMLVPAASGGSGGEGWKWNPLKLKKRTERVFKGIPDRWRSAAWGTLVEEKTARTRDRRLSVNQLRVQYRDLLDAPSEHDVQIDLDVPRTISGHVLFHTRYGQGQRSLFYVLHAFSQLCPSCGYVQGMGPIAATLLNYFEPERTYAILVRLHDEYEMHTIFQPGFPGLLENIYVQERLIERIMPGVYQALSTHMISSTSFVTKWYITLFANTVPYQTQLRLWDTFLLEGRDVLVIAAVAILWILKDHITAPQANFETILSLLSSTFVFEDEDGLFRWMEKLLSDTRLRAEMDTWRVEWARLVAEGKSGKALL
ncbi:TBC domain-containing protein C1778,09 [Schizosaccharomyces pombe 972h-] [Rhizoctonia solani]|uniref:TBC domain-containing protein C1778,09 [Schizosaccharomyces pombe 972h-] n=1 Tax=Rhizoctonia solani TaxID=456999 RepID=A0A0K6GDE5_9AGAM|nr:TBC domain-containing protein C1778,09 [Schizosaccharomyces pombe 972h-] [Rhizoctonia solani]